MEGGHKAQGSFHRTLLKHIPDAIYAHDAQGRILEVNQAACEQTGYSEAELCRMHLEELNPSRGPEDFQRLFSELIESGDRSRVFRSRHRRRDGSEFPVEVHLTLIRSEDEQLFLASVRDASLRIALEESLEYRIAFDQLLLDISTRLVNISPEQLDSVIEQVLADIGRFFNAGRTYVFEIDHDKQCFSNTHEWSAEGVEPEIDNLQALPFSDFPWLMSHILEGKVAHVPDVTALPSEFADEIREYQRQRIRSLIILPILQNGKPTGLFGLDAIWTPRSWDEETRNNLTLLAQLIASAMEAASMSAQMTHLAYHDPLTQLPNRKLLNDRIQQSARRCDREGACLLVMLLDLDDFKLINDSLSHRAGDEVLQEIARRLRALSRGSDTVARIGGDEFVLALEVRHMEEATDFARRVLSAISEPMLVEGQRTVMHSSLGISVYPEDVKAPEKLLRNADLAMYAAKAAGKNRFAFYERSMTEQARLSLKLRHELGQALNRNELMLQFQPRINLRKGQLSGAEALVRWKHPARGIVGPVDFLPMAERSDLICRIGHWVLEQAFIEASLWSPDGANISLSINLSARDIFDERHVSDLIGIARHHMEKSGRGLELEITESMLMEDMDKAISHMHQIKSALPGVRFAIDDFGSGYSSLNQLRQLPIDILKIDPAFISDLDRKDRKGEAIIRSIIQLAKNLELSVVAEGVETREQYHQLQALGCDEAQGFFFCKPVLSGQLLNSLDPHVLGQGHPEAHRGH